MSSPFVQLLKIFKELGNVVRLGQSDLESFMLADKCSKSSK